MSCGLLICQSASTTQPTTDSSTDFGFHSRYSELASSLSSPTTPLPVAQANRIALMTSFGFFFRVSFRSSVARYVTFTVFPVSVWYSSMIASRDCSKNQPQQCLLTRYVRGKDIRRADPQCEIVGLRGLMDAAS